MDMNKYNTADRAEDRYVFLLNGRCYGIGSIRYMSALFEDYVVANKMYGNESIDVRVVEVEKYVKEVEEMKRGLSQSSILVE